IIFLFRGCPKSIYVFIFFAIFSLYHYYEFPNEHMAKRHYGIRTGQHKLIHFYNDIDKWELYDLQEDPGEMNNLYGQPEYNEVIIELKKQLEILQAKYQDSDRSTY
ncbi:unnamed protein product, partial [marine sediment metagenome]